MDERSTYEELLERWALHDCSAFVSLRSDEEMRELFGRWRSTRSKPATAIGAVTMQSLDRAWTAFVERWNKETGPVFLRKLEARKAAHARLSLGDLASQLSTEYPRHNTDEWEGFLEEAPLSETERLVAGRYRAALDAARRGGRAPRRSVNLSPMRR
ncbi:Hypothetical protein PHPALM_17267 [Phytophthora palmivora]|uniref:Uncharacterized protein n=1 Tax=Phytophthora palmivora TaxID=4796 RepID=A0A2P4XMR1_9STRA|nr:Hypothetical protein PHPALM_17267 [Phytophthora palmivora]